MALTYRQAGVDIDIGESLVERIKPFAQATRTPFVVDGVGGFAGLCGLPGGMEEPVLVSGTDGVGTKLKLAFETNRHGTVGQDLVAMCVNDILTCGAKPLFFLDYFACGKLVEDTAAEVIRGIADGCKLAGCALLGGETAELPGMYPEGEYDLAGFAVGVADRKNLLGSARVTPGDELVALASSGLHSNGYSLARRVLQGELSLRLDKEHTELGGTVGDELLKPTRIYAEAVAALLAGLGPDVHAMSHITGGGVVGNLPRVLARGQVARLRFDHQRPAVFDIIQRGGPVEEAEMRRTFNLGIGLVIVVSAGKGDAAVELLTGAGERAWKCGTIASDGDAEPRVDIV